MEGALLSLKDNRNRVVVTLKKIVDQFINYPNNRDLEVNLPFIVATTYKQCFQRISFKYLYYKYEDFKIYYSQLLFNEQMHAADKFITITLAECQEWKTDQLTNRKYPFNPYVLNIDTKYWAEYHLQKFIREIMYVKEEGKREYNEPNNKLKPYIFFLSNAPENHTPFMFNADNPRLIQLKLCEVVNSFG